MARKKRPPRADGRYECRIVIGHNLDGTAIKKTFYSKVSHADARRKADEYKQAKAISAVTGDSMTSRCEAFDAWARKWLLTYKKPFVSVSTYKNTYENCVEIHLIPYFKSAKLCDIKPADIQLFFSEKSGSSQSMLKKLKNTLYAIFETAIENDIIFKNPVKHIQSKSAIAPKIRKALSDEQIRTVKTAAAGKLDAVCFLLETGLRRGELLGLMWSDIDLEKGILTVSRSVSLENGRPIIRPPKWDSYRTIPLLPETVQLLEAQPRRSLYVFPAPRGKGHDDPNHFSRRIYLFFKKLPEDCRCSAHELRHSYASQLMRQGVDIYTISKLLGHKDIRITAATYVHPDVESLRAELTAKKTQSPDGLLTDSLTGNGK